MELKEINPSVWKPSKVGDFIEGVLIEKELNKGNFDSSAYAIEKSGVQSLVWGSTVLDERMKYVKIGDFLRIEFTGFVRNKKNQDVKIFKVFKGEN